MSDGVKSLVQMLADLSPGDTLQTQAARLGHLFDGEAEVGEGALANLRAFAEQHGCKADYEAPSGMVRFEKAPPTPRARVGITLETAERRPMPASVSG